MSMRPLSTFLARLIWLSVLPLLFVAIWLAIDSVRTRQSGTRQEAINLAKNFATAIDHHVQARIAALQILASSPLADDPARWPELYIEAQGFRGSFGCHVILADTGEPMRMLFNTRSPFGVQLPALPQPKGNAAAPTALKTGRPAIGDSFMGPIVKEPLVAIAVPVIRDGKVTHLLLTIIETGQFQQRIEQMALPANWTLILKDGRGEIIARNAPAGFDARGEVDAEGRFEARSELSAWTVALEIPRDVIGKPLLSAAIALAFAIAAATAVGVLGGLLASRRLNSQLAALIAASPAEGSPLDIVEFAAVRQQLDESAANLRVSESRFESTFEQAAVGIALVATDDRCLRVNDQFCAIVGYSREELLALSPAELTHPDDRKADQDAKHRMLAGALRNFSREKRILHKDDGARWIKLSVALVYRQDGNPDYFISVIEDIQLRKQAEKALMASEQRCRELVENANSAIVHWSHDGCITFFNTFAQQLFGWSAAEIIGQHISILLPERDSAGKDLRGMVDDIIAHPAQYQNNINENVCRDGRRVWMNWTNRALVDEQGRVTGFFAIGNDLSDLKRMEALVHQGEQRIRFALESSQIGAWDLDLENHTAYRSLRHDQIFGYQTLLPEWTYAMFLAHVHPEDRDEVAGKFNHAVATGQDWNFECRIRRTDGQLRWIWAAGRHTEEEAGASRRIAGVVQDITERKLAEEELRRRNEELERFDRAAVGRELRMIELKRHINKLSRQLGQEPPFDLRFSEAP